MAKETREPQEAAGQGVVVTLVKQGGNDKAGRIDWSQAVPAPARRASSQESQPRAGRGVDHGLDTGQVSLGVIDASIVNRKSSSGKNCRGIDAVPGGNAICRIELRAGPGRGALAEQQRFFGRKPSGSMGDPERVAQCEKSGGQPGSAW